MKKTLLGLALLALSFQAVAQDVAPVSPSTSQTSGYTKIVPGVDTILYFYKGSTLGWSRMLRYQEVFPILNFKANLVSPVFTGNPTGPTPVNGSNNFSLATTAYVANNAPSLALTAPLTGFSANPSGALTATDNVLGAFGKLQNGLNYSNPITLNGTTNAITLGDSYTFGQGATSTNLDYVNQIVSALNLTVNNQGLAGSGTYYASSSFNNVATVPNQSLVTVLTGFNDLRRAGFGTPTLEKFRGSFRSILASAFVGTAVAANNVAITHAGAFGPISHTIGDKANQLGGAGQFTTANGATWTWTFSGPSLVIGTWNFDGTVQQGGTLGIVIDGVTYPTYNGNGLTDGVSDGVYDNNRTPTAIVIRGLGLGSHTVVITSGGITGAAANYLDYLGTLAAPGTVAPVVIGTVPYMTAAGYALVPNLGSIAGTDAANAMIRSVVKEFYGLPVTMADVNNYFFPNGADLFTDNVHPNNLGHAHIANAFLNQVKQVPGAILNQSTQQAASNFNISGNAYATGANSQSVVGGAANQNPNVSEPNVVFDIVNDANNNGGKYLFRAATYYNGAGLSNFHIQHARGTQAVPLPVQTGDFLMSMGFRGYKNTIFGGSVIAFQAMATTNYTDAGATGADLYVQSTNNTSNIDVSGRQNQWVFRNDAFFCSPKLWVGTTGITQPFVTATPTSDLFQVSGTSYLGGNTTVNGSLVTGTTIANIGLSNSLFSSINVAGTAGNKYQPLSVGVTNQLSFLAEGIGSPTIGFNADAQAAAAGYNAHETGYSGYLQFNKTIGSFYLGGNSSSATAGTAATINQSFILDKSGNGTFSGIILSGGIRQNHATKGTNYTLTKNDFQVSMVGGSTATLPDAQISGMDGVILCIKRIVGSAGTITIVDAAGRNIENPVTGVFAASVTLAAAGVYGSSAVFQSNGVAWECIAH